MKILILEPYLTTSHKKWTEGFDKLPHDIRIYSLPDRNWKWRMHGAAITFAKQLLQSNWIPEVIIASDMLDLNVFLSLTRRKTVSIPALLYFHENQLTYPASKKDKDRQKNWDNHYAFINYTSALSADKVIFNSNFHRSDFLNGLPDFIMQFPKPNNKDLIASLHDKSIVIEPGIDCTQINSFKIDQSNKIPIILWNHRWEYDKNPSVFFDSLVKIKADGHPFKLVVLGKVFQNTPSVFLQAEEELSEHILHFGFAPSEKEYYEWLWKSDIVISTSNQDYFGISLVEAAYCKCFPIAPNKLAFPEHIPDPLKAYCLFSNEKELNTLIVHCLKHPDWMKESTNIISDYSSRYDTTLMMEKYQDLLIDMMAQP